MQKTVFLCALFFFIFLGIGGKLIDAFGVANNSQDYLFHWNRANGINENNNYPGLSHWLFGFFSFNQYLFFGLAISIFTIFIPFFLFKLANSFWAVFLYFFVFSFPYFMFFGATYAEALALLFFLCYCLKRNVFAFFVFGGLAALTHNSGIGLFLVVGIAEILIYSFKQIAFVPVIYLLPEHLSIYNIGHVLLFQTPFAVLLPALKTPGFFYGIIICASVLYSRVNIRSLAVAQLIFCINAAKNISGYSLKYKITLIFFGFFQVLFFLGDYVLGTINLFYK